MSLAARLRAMAQDDWVLIVDTRASARGGVPTSSVIRPTKMRLTDAQAIDWLLAEQATPTALVTAKGVLWLLSDAGDGVVWHVGQGKPNKAQRGALEAVLEALSQEFPDVDVPLLDDEPKPEEASDE